jgi:hypothetical protein
MVQFRSNRPPLYHKCALGSLQDEQGRNERCCFYNIVCKHAKDRLGIKEEGLTPARGFVGDPEQLCRES